MLIIQCPIKLFAFNYAVLKHLFLKSIQLLSRVVRIINHVLLVEFISSMRHDWLVASWDVQRHKIWRDDLDAYFKCWPKVTQDIKARNSFGEALEDFFNQVIIKVYYRLF